MKQQDLLRKVNTERGFGLVEIVVAVVIVSITFFSFFAVFQSALVLARSNLHVAQAGFLLEEGIEATKSIRDEAWINITTLTVGNTYYFNWDDINSVWELTATPNTIDGLFTRTVVMGQVLRDANDDISTTGTVDDGTRLVTVIVSWTDGSESRQRELSTYVTNITNE